MLDNPIYLVALQKLQHLSILPDKSEENEVNTLQALWHTASGVHVSPIAAAKLELQPLSNLEAEILDGLIALRLSGIPLAHLTKRQHFMGMELWIEQGHYIPRKETELLAQTAIDTIRQAFSLSQTVTAIDLGTGVGTLALAMAHHCVNAQVIGTDIFELAITGAITNSEILNLNDRATFFRGSLFEPIVESRKANSFDLVVSAPPYISSAKVVKMAKEIAEHEPTEAFDAGPFGLSIFNQIISQAPEHLRPGGFLLLECGLGQCEFLAKQIRGKAQYKMVEMIADSEGHLRVLRAQVH